MPSNLRLGFTLKRNFKVNGKIHGPNTKIELASHGRGKTKIIIKKQQIIVSKEILEFKKIIEKAC